MTPTSSADSSITPSRWHYATASLLGGLTVASVLFAHVAVVQTPGLDPPPQTVALFIAAATIASVGYLLVKQGRPAGYLVGVLVGLTVLVELALIVGGVYGPGGPETNPIGPALYLLVAVAVLIVSALAWRERAETPTAADSAAPR